MRKWNATGLFHWPRWLRCTGSFLLPFMIQAHDSSDQFPHLGLTQGTNLAPAMLLV